jgi:hypothetical protein
MKLKPELIDRTLSQIHAESIPDDHPMYPKLRSVFGNHTFFLDESGLNIIEPVRERPETGVVMNVASWDDAETPTLVAHPPHSTEVMVELRPKSLH